MKKINNAESVDINDMLDRLTLMTRKVNKYIQGNGNSRRLKKKSQKACDLAKKKAKSA
jgi:hypothetical protein